MKSKKYIKKCVDSILAQTYLQVEIILVNDGSSDSSGVICDEYTEKYENTHKKDREAVWKEYIQKNKELLG